MEAYSDLTEGVVSENSADSVYVLELVLVLLDEVSRMEFDLLDSFDHVVLLGDLALFELCRDVAAHFILRIDYL